jgi:hypothetical protein
VGVYAGFARPQFLLVSTCLVAIAAAAAVGPRVAFVAPAAAAVAALAVLHRRLLSWPALLGVLTVIVMFLPIRRYTMPGNLPFELEPYRIVVLGLALAWLAALLVDPRVKARTTGLEAPLFALGAVFVTSILVNTERINELDVQADVAKALTFWLSFVILFFLLASVLPTAPDVSLILRLLVICGAVLGALAAIETKTDFNPFDHVGTVLPFLRLEESPNATTVFRAGQTRAYGSAQHPIALGACLAMLFPIAVAFAYTRRRPVWWAAVALIVIGSLATFSRTSVVMLAIGIVVLLILRPESRRLLPLLLPLAVAAQFAIPGLAGTLWQTFFPEGGLRTEQSRGGVGQGRLASLAPALEEVQERPLLGMGFGSRIRVGERANSFILDNEWLGILLETGVLGALAWGWLFVSFLRRGVHAARSDLDDRGWMLSAICASVLAFAIGMFSFDAFSFVQASIVLFVLLGVGCALLRLSPEPDGQSARSVRTGSGPSTARAS